jgi:antitoxin ParD1/3/4
MASSVNLGDQLEAFITEAVKKGRYGSRSEVLREGVRLVQEREAKWARFEEAMREAIAEADRGELFDADEVLDELEAKYKAMAKRDAA